METARPDSIQARPPVAERRQIRLATAADRPHIRALLRELWGSETIVSHGLALDATTLPALLALDQDQVVGLATLHFDGEDCELVTLNALDALDAGRGLVGEHGIPLHDELELELRLDGRSGEPEAAGDQSA